MQVFTLADRLPGMNEVLDSVRQRRVGKYGRHTTVYDQTKRDIEAWIAAELIAQRIQPYGVPVVLSIEFIESDDRRDRDNVLAGAKVLIDALRKAGILRNDTARWIPQLSVSVWTNRTSDVRVRVHLTPRLND